MRPISRDRPSAPPGGRPRAPVGSRWLLFGAAALLAGLAYAVFPAARETARRAVMVLASGDVHLLKEYILSFGWWAPAVSAALMILQTLIAPLPAFVLAVANAMVFGLIYGFLLTCASALAAALVAFYLSRWLGRPFVARWPASRTFDAYADRYGAWGVLILRLFPIVSFDFISFAAGLSAMRARHFALATLVGMLPAAVAFSLIGDSIETASRWSLIGGTLLLVALLLGTAVFYRRRGPAPAARTAPFPETANGGAARGGPNA